jgi:FtsP/CotA-like multicopper oxidase with cupredoxin domain
VDIRFFPAANIHGNLYHYQLINRGGYGLAVGCRYAGRGAGRRLARLPLCHLDDDRLVPGSPGLNPQRGSDGPLDAVHEGDAMNPDLTRRRLLKYAGGGLAGAGLVGAAPWLFTASAGAGARAEEQEELDPLAIPKYVNQLARPRVFAPTVVRDSRGRVIRHDYSISVQATRAQLLPPGFPQTTVFAYGGTCFIPGSTRTEFFLSSPGPVFDNVRGIPGRVTWRDRILQAHPLPVDPVVHWANPNTFEHPEPPFRPFPPGYAAAQFPVPAVTHTHGLVVAPQFDGTAEEWFTDLGQRGPSFVSNVYQIPNEQPGTQLFYHDHVMGITRLDVFEGLVGAAYFIRDPDSPLDRPDTPLPRGEFEIPLVVADRAFFTDGELNFPRESQNPFLPYFEAEDESDVVVVNGKAWPNLNVQRRQYRFRVLAASNMRVWQFQFQLGSLDGEFLPFTVIGSDGGYLPAPLEVDRFKAGITERSDILVDFSRFAPGTQILMRNTLEVEDDGEIIVPDPETVGQVMRFTVVDSPSSAPPVLSGALFPRRPTLTPNAPARTKVTVRFRDDPEHVTHSDRTRTIDGLGFSSPPTEFPLIGSTEQWNIVNTNDPDDDADAGAHQIHLHLIEFQILNRQLFDNERFLVDWSIFNGQRPTTRPIVLPMDDYLEGPIIPPEPNETGWKDTARADPVHVTRIIARWAPQEIPAGGVQPGQNLFPMDVNFPDSTDPFTGPGYVWHCHMLGHEDRDMMRQQPMVFLWRAGMSYPAGRVVAHNNVNYRARVAHTSRSGEPPTARFNLWERVNNNDGSWQPQIIYAVRDRVLHNGRLFQARHVFQAQPGQTPPTRPDLWEPLPMTAKGQLVFFCDPDDPETAEFFDIGQNGTEEEAREVLRAALAVCDPINPLPSSGITEDAILFDVPDGDVFRPAPTSGTTYYETLSELLFVQLPNQLSSGQSVTVNGRFMRPGVNYPLPPQRNEGYVIRVTGGVTFSAR